MAEQLHSLKRKRARERSNITRFSRSINSFTEDTAHADYDHYKGRLEEALERMLKLDDTIHDLLNDEEYDADVRNTSIQLSALFRRWVIALRNLNSPPLKT
jgi:hypothetical protein